MIIYQDGLGTNREGKMGRSAEGMDSICVRTADPSASR